MTAKSATGTPPDGSATRAVPPPFDPELAAALTVLADHIPRELTLDAMRQGAATVLVPDEELSRGGTFEITERPAPGPEGAPEISLLIARPAGTASPTAAIYHIHGGGMIIGSNRMGLPMVLDWAQELRASVVSVEYRLAPETPHPGPVEDCYAGLAWTAAHAGELGIDPGRIVVAGGSAGGGLAAAVTGAKLSYDSKNHVYSLAKGTQVRTIKTNDIHLKIKDGKSNIDARLLAKWYAGFTFSARYKPIISCCIFCGSSFRRSRSAVIFGASSFILLMERYE